MKRVFRPFAIACVSALSLTACQKNAKEAVAPASELSQATLAQISALGFYTDGARKVANGYLVEGDIVLSEADLTSQPSSPNLLIAKEEQYRTFNTVSATKHPVIKIGLSISNSTYTNAFTAAVDEAIRRYNAENLTVTFQRVSTGADITVVGFYENSNTLGSSGFPTNGDPYNEVRMNTYWYKTGTDATNTNYIGTIMAHEIGHCIGFRHTDYMNRAYSCGGRKQNEGQATTGVGAVHIAGTPTSGDPNSWMLACVGSNVNRPFNANDKIALSVVY